MGMPRGERVWGRGAAEGMERRGGGQTEPPLFTGIGAGSLILLGWEQRAVILAACLTARGHPRHLLSGGWGCCAGTLNAPGAVPPVTRGSVRLRAAPTCPNTTVEDGENPQEMSFRSVPRGQRMPRLSDTQRDLEGAFGALLPPCPRFLL